MNVNAVSPRLRLLLVMIASSLSTPLASMGAGQLDSLLNSTLFGSAKSGQPADAGNQPLEFRGVSEIDGQQLFSIYDTATKRSSLLTLNDTSNDVVIKSYDADTHAVNLMQNGKALSLTLKSGPRIAQNMTPPPPGMPAGAPNLPGMAGQQIPANGIGKGPEAQRMQQIAEEIRRRRALRQQGPQMSGAAPSPGTGPTPMPSLPGATGPVPVAPLPGASSAGPMPLPGASTPGPVPVPFQRQ